jgi:hypothetical protein
MTYRDCEVCGEPADAARRAELGLCDWCALMFDEDLSAEEGGHYRPHNDDTRISLTPAGAARLASEEQPA